MRSLCETHIFNQCFYCFLTAGHGGDKEHVLRRRAWAGRGGDKIFVFLLQTTVFLYCFLSRVSGFKKTRVLGRGQH